MLVKLFIRLLERFLLFVLLDNWLPRHFLVLDFLHLGRFLHLLPPLNWIQLFFLFFNESRILTVLLLTVWFLTLCPFTTLHLLKLCIKKLDLPGALTTGI